MKTRGDAVAISADIAITSDTDCGKERTRSWWDQLSSGSKGLWWIS